MSTLTIQIPHDAIVFVGDGRKALFLRNAGDEQYLNLKPERVFLDHNPPTHQQGTDRPGRTFSSVGPGRSAVESTDWHDLEQHRFVRAVSAALEKLVRARHVRSLIIVAPPRTLADLRRDLHDDVKVHILAEISKDLTKHTTEEIEKHLLE
jgi:protein required for attachment to host cells